ncbi:ABC transporter substrate-binding protein [Aquibacillus albus]|uniref:Peptide/nickel transport system substrate-binding protein n=1 Tax=Aquibacillus albus TaxID=1168171 RepID=A0ABS2MWU6_9BACI|nr:ABC transporter substrate-binding protein [Aquibacillus albus]MBM7570369.1 peptide/nickel transport system substrate-binding protein [Aquibacillus albus]
MRKLFLFALLLAFSFLMVACSSASSSTDGNDASEGDSDNQSEDSSSSNSESKDTLVIGLDDDPPQLDPHRSSAAVDRQTFQSLYNKLIDINENLELEPELATDWNISDDGLTYTLTLQEGVTFHDGTDFNAEAVKFNFERMLDPDFASPRASEVNLIEEVNVLGDYEVEIVLSEPFAPFLSVLTDRAGMMVSPTAVEELGDDFANQPVGTGPYEFVERVAQSKIELTRYEGYWREKPAIANVEIRPFPDANVRVTNLVSGELDLLNKIAFKDIEKLKEDPSITLLEKDALGYQGIHLNTEVEPFTNKNIRQAINLAIDREAITRVVFHGGAVPAVSAFAPSSWAAPDFEQPNADVEAAKALVEESGLTDVSFTLKINPKPEEEQMAQMMQAMLSEVGITMEIEMVEFGTMLDQLSTGDFEAVRLGWSGRTDPDGNAYRFFYTDAPNNYTNYSNPEVDGLLDEARTVSVQEERKAMYDQLSEILWDDAPYIFLYHERDYKAMKNYVKGFEHVADTMVRTESVYFE